MGGRLLTSVVHSPDEFDEALHRDPKVRWTDGPRPYDTAEYVEPDWTLVVGSVAELQGPKGQSATFREELDLGPSGWLAAGRQGLLFAGQRRFTNPNEPKPKRKFWKGGDSFTTYAGGGLVDLAIDKAVNRQGRAEKLPTERIVATAALPWGTIANMAAGYKVAGHSLEVVIAFMVAPTEDSYAALRCTTHQGWTPERFEEFALQLRRLVITRKIEAFTARGLHGAAAQATAVLDDPTILDRLRTNIRGERGFGPATALGPRELATLV